MDEIELTCICAAPRVGLTDDNIGQFWVQCFNCGLATTQTDTPTEALKIWQCFEGRMLRLKRNAATSERIFIIGLIVSNLLTMALTLGLVQ